MTAGSTKSTNHCFHEALARLVKYQCRSSYNDELVRIGARITPRGHRVVVAKLDATEVMDARLDASEFIHALMDVLMLTPKVLAHREAHLARQRKRKGRSR